MALPYLHSWRHDGVPVCTGRQAARGKSSVRAISWAAWKARKDPRAPLWAKTSRWTVEQRISRADMHAPATSAGQSSRQRSSRLGSSQWEPPWPHSRARGMHRWVQVICANARPIGHWRWVGRWTCMTATWVTTMLPYGAYY